MQTDKANFGLWTTLCAVFMVACQPAASHPLATTTLLLPSPTPIPTVAPAAIGTPEPDPLRQAQGIASAAYPTGTLAVF